MQRAHEGLALHRHGDVDRAHRVYAVPVRAGEPRHADADFRPREGTDPLGHGLRHGKADRSVCLDQLRLDAEELRLRLVRIGAAHEDAARPRDLGDAPRNVPAGAALRRGETHPLLQQKRQHRLLHAFDVHPVDHVAQAFLHMRDHRGHHRLGLRLALRLGGDLQQTVALLCVGGHGRVRHTVHLIPEELIHRALPHAENTHGM